MKKDQHPKLNKIPDIIPKKILFGNPDKSSPRISPDGNKLAYLSNDINNVLNIFVRDLKTSSEEQVTHDNDRGITAYQWHYNSDDIFFIQDTKGDENWLLYKIKVETKEQQCLTPFENVQVQIVDRAKHMPNDMLLAMNKDNPQLHDVYHLNIETGELTLRVKNPGNVTDWLSDYNLQIRGALLSNDKGGFDLKLRATEEDEFYDFYKWNHEDSANSGPLILSKDGESIYILDSTFSNATRLVKMDIETKKQEIIFEDEQFDISWAIIHPDSLELQLIAVTKDREHHFILDKSIENDIKLIKGLHPDNEFFLGNRTNDDNIWIIGYIRDDGPVPYYIYNRGDNPSFQFLFHHHNAILDYKLSKIETIKYQSRDGLTIYGYISFPIGLERKKLPTVLNVHGGPWSRDNWGFDSDAQLFTNRGYICLQVNYRGSSGFGKEFLNAGDKEWGNKMLFDMVDAVNWVVTSGFADPNKIAIYGGSYGGYAALAAATFTTGVFCCAVDIVGPSNIITFIKSIPEYWKPFLSMLHKRVGNPDVEEEFLKSRSPLFHAQKISIPLLIAHGANDPRVKQEESEQIVEKLKENGIPHTYLLFEDEGHGLIKPENRMRFYEELERFFFKHLGGRIEEN